MDQKEKEAPINVISLEEGWEGIKTKGIDVLEGILKNKMAAEGNSKEEKLTFSREDAVGVYSSVFAMCNQPDPYNWSGELYNRYVESVELFMSEHVAPVVQADCAVGGGGDSLAVPDTITNDEELLSSVLEHWVNFQFYSKWMHSFFHVLDRMHAQPKQKLKVKQVAVKTFHQMVMEMCLPNVNDAVLNLIRRDREGDKVDRSLVIAAARFLKDLDQKCGETELSTLHMERLEEAVLAATREYYASKREEWMRSPPDEYYAVAEEAIEAEKLRITEFLCNVAPSSSSSAILECTHQELLDKGPAPVKEPPADPWLEEHEEAQSSFSCARFIPLVGLFVAKKKDNKESPAKEPAKEGAKTYDVAVPESAPAKIQTKPSPLETTAKDGQEDATSSFSTAAPSSFSTTTSSSKSPSQSSPTLIVSKTETSPEKQEDDMEAPGSEGAIVSKTETSPKKQEDDMEAPGSEGASVNKMAPAQLEEPSNVEVDVADASQLDSALDDMLDSVLDDDLITDTLLDTTQKTAQTQQEPKDVAEIETTMSPHEVQAPLVTEEGLPSANGLEDEHQREPSPFQEKELVTVLTQDTSQESCESQPSHEDDSVLPEEETAREEQPQEATETKVPLLAEEEAKGDGAHQPVHDHPLADTVDTITIEFPSFDATKGAESTAISSSLGDEPLWHGKDDPQQQQEAHPPQNEDLGSGGEKDSSNKNNMEPAMSHPLEHGHDLEGW